MILKDQEKSSILKRNIRKNLKFDMIYLQKPSQNVYAYCFISEDSKHFLILRKKKLFNFKKKKLLANSGSTPRPPPSRLADASVNNA